MTSAVGLLQRAQSRLRRRQARRDFYGQLRPSDVFVVGYPRSGNTWLGFMLANALNAERQEALNLDNLTDHVPDVNDFYFWGEGDLEWTASLPDPRFSRLHATYDPRLPNVVYVLRDPRDTIVSHYHLRRLEDAEFSLDMHDFVTSYDHWPSSWDAHVGGWLDAGHPRLMVVRYEDMKEDATRELARVLSFGGLDLPDSAVESAVEAARFDRMRKLEEKFGPVWPGSGEERTVRRGTVGGWRDELDERTLAAIERVYGATMDRVGYARVSGS